MLGRFCQGPRDLRIIRIPAVFVLVMGLTMAMLGSGAAAQASNAVLLTLEGNPLTAAGSLVNGTTMVPVEALGAELGFKVSIPSSEDRIIVSKADKKVELSQGRSVALVSGHEIRIPERPVIVGDKIMVPLRFLLETMGYEVVWQSGTINTVDLRPITENDLVIGTVRERRETATLSVDVQYPKIAGLAAEVQDPMNAYFADRVKPAVDQGYRSAEANDAVGESRWPTEVFLNYRIAYNQKGLLSVLFDDYLYTGGAHGGIARHGYTTDIRTGKSYALKDLFEPDTDYVSLLSAEIKEQIEARELTLLSPFEAIREDQDFYIERDSLVVYFQQYELMAYAYGFPEFRIPMSSLADVLTLELAGIVWTTAD